MNQIQPYIKASFPLSVFLGLLDVLTKILFYQLRLERQYTAICIYLKYEKTFVKVQ